jgi:hypothetical protein
MFLSFSLLFKVMCIVATLDLPLFDSMLAWRACLCALIVLCTID